MQETIEKIRKLTTKKKIKISGYIIGILFIILFLIPFIRIQLHITGLRLINIDKIEYVQYEGDAFESNIISKKKLSYDIDQEKMRELLKNINNGTIHIYIHSDRSSQMLFFYLKDGRIINAFIDKDRLGFDYGKSWIKVKDLGKILEVMSDEATIVVSPINQNK